MARVVHGFDPPERFVAGTVGPPGQRTFFLQARSGQRVVSVALEKEQVAMLAERIDLMLDRLMAAGGSQALIPAVAPLDLDDNAPLEQPIQEEFRVGTMRLIWDKSDQRIVIEVYPYDEEAAAAAAERAEQEDEEDEEAVEPDADEVLIVRLAAGAARAFVKRAGQVVEAGRPRCPFCGSPIDPDGHLCVRANGFRRRDP